MKEVVNMKNRQFLILQGKIHFDAILYLILKNVS